MIHLVRHGETAYNRDSQGLGRMDVPLTDRGLLQAEAVAKRFANVAVERVISSPLSRASVVAEHIAARHGLVVERIEALTELDVGETEGLGFPEMRERFAEFLKTWAGDDGWRAPMPGGESIKDLALRVESLLPGLLEERSEDVVVVSHNFTLRVLACLLAGVEPSRFRSFELGLASVSTFTVRGGRTWVRTVNDTCHLSSLNLA